MKRLRTHLRRFRRSERGTFSVETVLIVPLLLFCFAGLFTFFDAFRMQNVNVRASYTVSDLISREDNLLTTDYVTGMNQLLSLLTQSKHPTIIRVTAVTYDEDADELSVVWSAVDGGTEGIILPLVDGTLDEIEDQIPIMAHGAFNIVVESWAAFEPVMTWGLGAFYFENTVVTRPRFAPNLCFEDGELTQNSPCLNAS